MARSQTDFSLKNAEKNTPGVYCMGDVCLAVAYALYCIGQEGLHADGTIIHYKTESALKNKHELAIIGPDRQHFEHNWTGPTGHAVFGISPRLAD